MSLSHFLIFSFSPTTLSEALTLTLNEARDEVALTRTLIKDEMSNTIQGELKEDLGSVLGELSSLSGSVKKLEKLESLHSTVQESLSAQSSAISEGLRDTIGCIRSETRGMCMKCLACVME